MIRWKYVVPRLLVLAIVTVGIWLCGNTVLRWSIQQSLQQITGAKVDIGGLHADLARGDLQIEHLRIADRSKEFRNLLQFERASFDVEMQAALRRKLVIRGGRLEGLRFGTPRDDDGQLAVSTTEDDTSPSFSVNSRLSEVGTRAEAWLGQQTAGLEDQLKQDLHMVQLSRELADRWPTAYQELERQAQQIEQQAQQVKEQIRPIKQEPLKHLEEIPSLMTSIDQIRTDVSLVRKQLRELQGQLREDQDALREAKRHDEQYLRERLHLEELDGNSLTEYLLGPTWSQRLTVALRWLQHSRDAVPATTEPVSAQTAARGVSVVFPGFPATADVLVRELRLTGDGTIDEQPFQFTGVIRDLTHQPRRHDEPATIAVQAEGAIQLAAQAVLDRRSAEPVDRFVVDIPALRQHEQILGNPAKLGAHRIAR